MSDFACYSSGKFHSLFCGSNPLWFVKFQHNLVEISWSQNTWSRWNKHGKCPADVWFWQDICPYSEDEQVLFFCMKWYTLISPSSRQNQMNFVCTSVFETCLCNSSLFIWAEMRGTWAESISVSRVPYSCMIITAADWRTSIWRTRSVFDKSSITITAQTYKPITQSIKLWCVAHVDLLWRNVFLL